MEGKAGRGNLLPEGLDSFDRHCFGKLQLCPLGIALCTGS
jgi:hypothetical protein